MLQKFRSEYHIQRFYNHENFKSCCILPVISLFFDEIQNSQRDSSEHIHVRTITIGFPIFFTDKRRMKNVNLHGKIRIVKFRGYGFGLPNWYFDP